MEQSCWFPPLWKIVQHSEGNVNKKILNRVWGECTTWIPTSAGRTQLPQTFLSLSPFFISFSSNVLAFLQQQYPAAVIMDRIDAWAALDQYLCKGRNRASQNCKLTSRPIFTLSHRTSRKVHSQREMWDIHLLKGKKKSTPNLCTFYISPSGCWGEIASLN